MTEGSRLTDILFPGMGRTRPLRRASAKRKRLNVEQVSAVSVGDAVVYYNPVGRPHAAIVTAVWSATLINVVYVSKDETRTDTYGRQIERATSLSHKSTTTVHGNYWAYADETPNPVVQPQQT